MTSAPACMRLLLVLAFISMLSSCAPGLRLETAGTAPAALSGTADLLLFGCRHPDDIVNTAFLDESGDAYSLEVVAPSFEVKGKKQVPKEQALAEAKQFLNCTFHEHKPGVRTILGPEGQVVGYEVRPHYSSLRFGMSDVLLIEYRLQGDMVKVYVRLDPNVEAFLNNYGDDRGRDREKRAKEDKRGTGRILSLETIFIAQILVPVQRQV